ncbi:MAG: NAD-glutamate dehydrogenase, partial [Gammaproteobacteria bacterium]|nr:NAD-glutamate dehydrogenase [Gammaproteobacteria bacterium]
MGTAQTTRIPRRRITLIDGIVRAARALRGAPPAALLRDYFRGVGEEDLAAHSPRALALLASKHYELAQRRRAGETLVQAFSPEAGDPTGDRYSFVLVVTDDRPFLVDSLSLAFSSASIGVQMLIHPVLDTHRRRDGRLLSAAHASGPSQFTRESWQLYEIDRQSDEGRLAAIGDRLRSALDDVRATVEDWRPMRQ